MVQNSAFIHCRICDNRFSGPEPYQQHINSQKHKSKAGTLQDSGQATADDTLHCEVCNVNISGPIPYAQHIEGSKHKSQLNKKQIVAELSAGSSGDNEQASLYPNLTNLNSPVPVSGGTTVVVNKCELCGVCFSGPENMKEHLESKGHKRKMELENWNSVLGQNKLPASAPPIQDGDTSVNTTDDTQVPVIENIPELPNQPIEGNRQQPMAQEKKKHKKPIGCFKVFQCISKRKNKKDKIRDAAIA